MTRRAQQEAQQINEAPAPVAEATEPFTLEEVKALVAALEGTDVSSLRWNRNGQQIVIRRGPAAPVTQFHQPLPFPGQLATLSPAIQTVTAPAPSAPSAAAPVAPKPEAKPGVIVKSPFVGTFYRAPSPDSPPFVDVGTVVKKGQVLCIVEAMKLMNELEADAAGRIAEIFVANATMVELGHPLFRIEPA